MYTTFFRINLLTCNRAGFPLGRRCAKNTIPLSCLFSGGRSSKFLSTTSPFLMRQRKDRISQIRLIMFSQSSKVPGNRRLPEQRISLFIDHDSPPSSLCSSIACRSSGSIVRQREPVPSLSLLGASLFLAVLLRSSIMCCRHCRRLSAVVRRSPETEHPSIVPFPRVPSLPDDYTSAANERQRVGKTTLFGLFTGQVLVRAGL